MTPLDIIKTWFVSLNKEHQYEIAGLSGHFHLDQRIDFESEKELKLKLFIDYLDITGISELDVVTRTLFITRLLDFSFTGRDTDNGWTETLDRLLMLRSRSIEKGMNTKFVDEQLDRFNERKEAWLVICHSWEKLKSSELTDKQIADWYFFYSKEVSEK